MRTSLASAELAATTVQSGWRLVLSGHTDNVSPTGRAHPHGVRGRHCADLGRRDGKEIAVLRRQQGHLFDR
jgi:hypothetical protein